MAEASAIADAAATVDDIPMLALQLATGKRRHQHLVTTATRIWQARHQSRLGIRPSSSGWTAGSGFPRRDAFRSEWERRLAAALTRLGMAWQYEPRRLRYTDGSTAWHSYTPDFAIAGLPDVFIEVKGPAGADSVDRHKLTLVLASNPWATVLVWDASIIEAVEDAEHAGQVLGIARKMASGRR